MVKIHLAGGQGVELAEPLVFQVEGVDQQQGGVLVKGLVDDVGYHLVGVVGHPAVQIAHNPGGGQLSLEDLGVEYPPALADKVVLDLAVRVHPQAVGDGALGGAVQIAVDGGQRLAGGVDRLNAGPIPQQGFKLGQGVPVRAVGGHGQGQGHGEGGDQGGRSLRLPGFLQQLQPEAGQGGIDAWDLRALGRHVGVGELDGGGGELLCRGGLGAARQQRSSQGAGQEQGKGSFHGDSSFSECGFVCRAGLRPRHPKRWGAVWGEGGR